jgi:hypothetical protein
LVHVGSNLKKKLNLASQAFEIGGPSSNRRETVRSGKEHLRPETHAVFFCYRLPAEDKTLPSEDAWEGEAGRTGWYIYNVTSDSIVEDSAAIAEIIRSTLKTPRHCVQSEETLREIRLKVEKHIKNTYLKQVQAPIGVRAVSGHC